MDRFNATAASAAAIAQAAYLVRMYHRPGQTRQRAAAVRQMGAAVREAFNQTEEFEALLYAVADGLYPFEEQRHDRRRG